MDNQKTYISILIDSLEKKLTILNQIINLNECQKNAISSVKIDEEEFERVFSEKDVLIKEINMIDNGFESVYEHVKNDLEKNRILYSKEIETLKNLISEITEKSMEVQLTEKRNQQEIQTKFINAKQQINQNRAISKVATNYYKNMSKTNTIDPQFLDKKQ